MLIYDEEMRMKVKKFLKENIILKNYEADVKNQRLKIDSFLKDFGMMWKQKAAQQKKMAEDRAKAIKTLGKTYQIQKGEEPDIHMMKNCFAISSLWN